MIVFELVVGVTAVDCAFWGVCVIGFVILICNWLWVLGGLIW